MYVCLTSTYKILSIDAIQKLQQLLYEKRAENKNHLFLK